MRQVARPGDRHDDRERPQPDPHDEAVQPARVHKAEQQLAAPLSESRRAQRHRRAAAPPEQPLAAGRATGCCDEALAGTCERRHVDARARRLAESRAPRARAAAAHPLHPRTRTRTRAAQFARRRARPRARLHARASCRCTRRHAPLTRRAHRQWRCIST